MNHKISRDLILTNIQSISNLTGNNSLKINNNPVIPDDIRFRVFNERVFIFGASLEDTGNIRYESWT